MRYIGEVDDVLFTRYKELDKRFATINSKKINKTPRIEVTILNSVLPVSKKEISDILPDVSAMTIEAGLGKMLMKDKMNKGEMI